MQSLQIAATGTTMWYKEMVLKSPKISLVITQEHITFLNLPPSFDEIHQAVCV